MRRIVFCMAALIFASVQAYADDCTFDPATSVLHIPSVAIPGIETKYQVNLVFDGVSFQIQDLQEVAKESVLLRSGSGTFSKPWGNDIEFAFLKWQIYDDKILLEIKTAGGGMMGGYVDDVLILKTFTVDGRIFDIGFDFFHEEPTPSRVIGISDGTTAQGYRKYKFDLPDNFDPTYAIILKPIQPAFPGDAQYTPKEMTL